jgi:hypothetical protein
VAEHRTHAEGLQRAPGYERRAHVFRLPEVPRRSASGPGRRRTAPGKSRRGLHRKFRYVVRGVASA